jgi:hypothetical protein
MVGNGTWSEWEAVAHSGQNGSRKQQRRRLLNTRAPKATKRPCGLSVHGRDFRAAKNLVKDRWLFKIQLAAGKVWLCRSGTQACGWKTELTGLDAQAFHE